MTCNDVRFGPLDINFLPHAGLKHTSVASTMAFNPSAFETQYGFSFMDEMHNFFPELMYDETLFPQPNMMWMRHRLQTLFPHVYPRQRSLYHIYSAEGRRDEVLRWRTPPPPPAPMPAPTPMRMGPTPLVSPRQTRIDVDVLDVSGVRTTRTLNRDLAPQSLFTSLILDLAPDPNTSRISNFLTEGLLNLAFQDVPVRPSESQIAAASRILQHSEVHQEETCAVCQSRGPEQPWRVLHCSHAYHQGCIDEWFRINVHCPICRRDIRNITNPHAT